MAIAFITKASGTISGYAPSPLTISGVACGTAADTIVIGWILSDSGVTNEPTSMSVGGDTTGTTATALLTNGSNDYSRLFFWRGAGPGTVDIGFIWTGDVSQAVAGVAVYSGVDDLTGLTTAINASGTTSLSVTVTSATGDLAVGVWVREPSTSAVTSQGGTLRMDDPGLSWLRHTVCDEPGAASVVVDATTGSTTWVASRWGFSLTTAAAPTTSLPPIPSLLQRVPALRMR